MKCLVVMCLAFLLIGSLVYAEDTDIEKESPAVAIVNDVKIPMSDFDREMNMAMASNPGANLQMSKEEYLKMRQDVLNYLIDQELIYQEGNKLGLSPKDSEVNAEFENIKGRFGSQEEFDRVLKQQNLTEASFRTLIKRAMTMRKLVEVKVKPLAKPVTDEDVANFYEAHKEGFFEPERVNASHVLIKVEPDSSEKEKEEAKSKIESILNEARSGADFAEVAKKNSECPTAQRGGELGYFTRGQMVKPFEDAAFALEAGQISDVVETQFGYHIILVKDKRPKRQLTLEEVSDQIREALFDEEMDATLTAWLKPIKEKSKIDILLKD